MDTCLHPPCKAATQGVWRSLKYSVGPAVLKKPRIVVYLICQKSGLQLLNTRGAAFQCNYNTKPVRSAFLYFDWKSPMEIAFSEQKNLISTFFWQLLQNQIGENVFSAGCPNHACCKAVFAIFVLLRQIIWPARPFASFETMSDYGFLR